MRTVAYYGYTIAYKQWTGCGLAANVYYKQEQNYYTLKVSIIIILVSSLGVFYFKDKNNNNYYQYLDAYREC